MQKVVNWLVRVVLVAVVAAVLGVSVWTYAAMNYVYSTGERAGYVQKFSKRGWLFKTWEGELAMVNLPGAMPEIFSFTVRRPDAAAEIEKTMGHRVVLSYHQHPGIPTNIFGETQYFIVTVRTVEDAAAPAPLPAKN